jgi:2-keto-4-pentenoate hydratase
MSTTEITKAASDLLWANWQAGTVLRELPADMRPTTRAEGYAIQAHLAQRSPGPLYGWKIAATSTAGQKHIGVDGPIAGLLLGNRSHASGGTVSLDGNHMRLAEPEFAFRVGRTVVPRATAYTVDEAVAHMASLHPAIEIPDSRYEDCAKIGAAHLIADNACGRDFVLGAAAQDGWRALDLAAHPVHAKLGARISREGIGRNVYGDPRLALAWILNELSAIGVTIAEGQVITTGTCMEPIDVRSGETLDLDYGPLGTVSARFV